MAKTSGQFSYRIRAPRKGDAPFNAIVHICSDILLACNWPLLSPQLMTEQETDWHIRAYKAVPTSGAGQRKRARV